MHSSPRLRSEDRRHHRHDVWLEGTTLREPGCAASRVRVEDLSSGGFKTEWPYKLSPGKLVWLKLPGFEALEARVMWNEDFVIGCKFEHDLHPAVMSAIASANPPHKAACHRGARAP